MTKQSINIDPKQTAEALLLHRTANAQFDSLPEAIQPYDIESALAVQKSLIEQNKHQVAGWKCLLPPADDQIVMAPIFENTVHSGQTCELMADNQKARVEPEIAFILAADLPAKTVGYSDKEIADSIQSCHMALELMQNRYQANATPVFYEKLADGLTNQGLYIGPELDKDTVFASSDIQIKVQQNGETREFNGKHPNQKAAAPLTWFINFATENGFELKKGQAIITGSFAGIVEFEFGEAEIEYQQLGQYKVKFIDKK